MLVLNKSECLVSNLKRLSPRPLICGVPISAVSSDPPQTEFLHARTTDLVGKLGNLRGRPHLAGDPHHGTVVASRTVTVTGFPGKLEMEAVKHYLRGYEVLGQETGNHLLTQVPLYVSFSCLSSWSANVFVG